jgi:hypothetical protein
MQHHVSKTDKKKWLPGFSTLKVSKVTPSLKLVRSDV